MYFFEATLRLTSEAEKEFLIIFSGQLEGSGVDYAGIFEKKFSNYLKPDAILFIYPSYLKETLSSYWEEDNLFYQNITRFGSNVPVYSVSFDAFGDLISEQNVHHFGTHINLENIKSQVIEQGLLHLARVNRGEVILESPPGTIFSKPSGEASEEFIKASGLAKNYSQQQFVAYCLISYRPRSADIKEIYIDTAGISSFAEAVCYYLYRFSSAPCKYIRYDSFSSYGGMNKCKIDNPENVWVIISASHNNSMYVALINKWRLPPEHAVTILAFTDKPRRLVNISELSKHIHAKEQKDSAVKVHIVGENFTAEVSEPKKVIVKKAAKPVGLERVVKSFYDSGVFQCNKVAKHGRKPKPIFVNFNESVSSHPEFIEWLEKIVRWYLPSELGWVAVSDDPASQSLYKIFKEKIDSVGIKSKYKKIDFKSAGQVVTGDKSVVVLTPVISSGRTLLNLNRELRLSGHNGNRIFVAPFSFPSTDAEYKTLKNSLLLGPDGFRYQFFSFFELAIGNNDQESSWELEEKVVRSICGSSKLWNERLKRLEKQGSGLDGFIGCPPSTGVKKLSFSRHFAFWSGWDVNHEKADPEAIYLTLSAVLQHLREMECNNDNPDSLRSHVYQHAVIDPENFARFNDSILQSCLWRAANATELDYRRSDDLSYAMMRIIMRLINDLKSKKSESAVDLLMGIATGKICLSKKSLGELVDKAKVRVVGNNDVIILLNYIKTNYIDRPIISKS